MRKEIRQAIRGWLETANEDIENAKKLIVTELVDTRDGHEEIYLGTIRDELRASKRSVNNALMRLNNEK